MKTMILLALISFSSALFAQEDIQIVTDTDKRFCSSAVPQNQNISAHSLIDNGSVYRVGKNRWTEEHEVKFALWVQANVKKDFFKKFNIVTDCADAALSIRAIFARIHHLPVAFVGGLYTHEDKRWKNLSTVKNWDESNWQTSLLNDKRFRAALAKWNLDTGTPNIHLDTFQIEIRNPSDTNRISTNVRPGAVLLSGGHTRFVSEIDSLSWSPVKKLNSTVPAAVRDLGEGYFDLDFPTDTDKTKPDRGILNWNWVVNCNGKFKHVADNKMPSYSQEQMRFSSIYKNQDYRDLISSLSRARMLQNPTKSDIDKMIEMLIQMTHERSDMVNQGYTQAVNHPQEIRDLQGALYDQFSTPNRDQHLKEFYKSINKVISGYGEKIGFSTTDLAQALLDDFITIANGKQISVYHFMLALDYDKVSPHPFDSLDQRWGMGYLEERKTAFTQEAATVKNDLEDYKDQQTEILKDIQDNEKEYKKHAGWSSFLRSTKVLSYFSRYTDNWANSDKNQITALNDSLNALKANLEDSNKKIKFIEIEKKALGL